MIPYGRQSINDADVKSVLDALTSDWLTQGPAVPRFEAEVASRVDARHAIALSNATAALHAACAALDVGPGDSVWTSPNTFVASANCARYLGASVDFVDIDPRTYNMSVEALEEKLAAASRAGRVPKVVIPVHFAGQSCDMRGIADLARTYGFRVVEDASHAIGGSWESHPVGCGTYSDAVVFSFHPVKIITTGEGGMVLTNNDDVAKRVALFRSHGITRSSEELRVAGEGAWYYEQQTLGYNYRMTDLQAALGSSQMARLDDFVARRRALAARYDHLLAALQVARPWQAPQSRSAWHLYVVQIDTARCSRSRREVFESMRRSGIGVNVHYIPVHLQPYDRELGFREGMFPQAESYYRRTLTLPLHFGLSESDQTRVVAALAEALG